MGTQAVLTRRHVGPRQPREVPLDTLFWGRAAAVARALLTETRNQCKSSHRAVLNIVGAT
jgi:hypothetical protein